MADILKSLGDAMERQQQRKHENNMEVLRAINTRPGMVVLGITLLVIALVLFGSQSAGNSEKDSPTDIVIGVDDFDFGDEDINRIYQEMLQSDYEEQLQRERTERITAIGLCVAAAGCFLRAALPWKKKEQVGTISEEPTSKESGDIPISTKPVENSAMPSAETDSREDRLENLKRLYEAGILSREEYDERRKKL